MNSKPASTFVPTNEGVVLQGYHKKLKTMKKKYFVLYGDSSQQCPARLEYYDNEKKFKSRSLPKRKIILKNCFNINRRLDTKHKHVIALSIKDGGFCIVFETEDELNMWFRTLLTLQRGEATDSEPPKPDFEHVWQVQVQRKGLAEENGLIGYYHVCLKSTSIVFVRIGSSKTNLGEHRLPKAEFYLTTIRRCGDSQCFFFMEIGRNSVFGAGELWMETEDILIAKNMHRMILNAMSAKSREDGFRQRSSSANEASKPITVLQRRQTHSGYKPLSSSSPMASRERCDSLPSRNRTISECSNQNDPNIMPPPKTMPSVINRPHSFYTNRHSHSPPTNQTCFESEGSSLSIDETDSIGHSLASDDAGNYVRHYSTCQSQLIIPEENSEQFMCDDTISTSVTSTITSVATEKRKFDEFMVDSLNNQNNALSLPLNKHNSITTARKGNLPQCGSVENQSSYMDMMCSPCGSSPCDPNGSGYMPVSPAFESSRGLYTTSSSGGHSRASSLAEETLDGYVPMLAPQQSQDFIDIEPMKQSNAMSFSPAASSCSITSGTPSTDLKFAEYPLQKVISCFTPDADDLDQSNERPVRAYSVGSRLEFNNKRKLNRIELYSNEQNNSRVRAFSVGSRAPKYPRCDGSHSLITNFTCHTTNNNNNSNGKIHQSLNSTATTKESKSSSVPLLGQKNQSVERMSDLMEIDFSRNSQPSTATKKNTNTRVIKYSSPIAVPNANKNNHFNATPFAVSGEYLEMKPRTVSEGAVSEKQHSLTKLEECGYEGYLEMKPISYSSDSGNNNISSCSPSKLKSREKSDPEYINIMPYNNKDKQKIDDNSQMNRSSSMPIKIKAQESAKVTENMVFPKTIFEDPIPIPNKQESILNETNLKNSVGARTINNKVDCIIDGYANMTLGTRRVSQDAVSDVAPKVKRLNVESSRDFIDKNIIKEFKPITSKNDEQYFQNICRDNNSRRPNSVNSEMISPLKALSRPNSANSENMISVANATAVSTSSSSSTLCGSSSSSTLCNSNKSQSPMSRMLQFSDTDTTMIDIKLQQQQKQLQQQQSQDFLLTSATNSRPPSVSSEKELNYASLDLPPSDNKTNSNCFNPHKSVGGGESSSTSPSPNGSFCQKQQPTFTYAQIDFNQSEKNTSKNVPMK